LRLAALVRIFIADHYRTTALLMEIILVLLFLFIFLDPRQQPYTWSQLVISVTIIAMVISALTTSLLVWRNADQKIDVFLLKTGRVRYFLGVLLAAVFITSFWICIIAFYIYLFLSPNIMVSQLLELVTATALIIITVSSLFLLFSLLTGNNYESCVAIIILILGLNTPYFINLGEPFHVIATFLPPLQEIIYAVNNNLNLPLGKSMVYAAVVLAFGLLRFARREFIRS
jgi:hypothetical protein